MTRERFRELLEQSTCNSIDFARRFVFDTLPDSANYQVLPNQSYDGDELEGDETVFPEDSLGDIDAFHEMTALGVVDFLWRDGKAPEWIDIRVIAVKDRITIMELTCCGRYTASDNLLYYMSEDNERSPFGIKSPILPPRHPESDPPKKFDLFDPKERK